MPRPKSGEPKKPIWTAEEEEKLQSLVDVSRGGKNTEVPMLSWEAVAHAMVYWAAETSLNIHNREYDAKSIRDHITRFGKQVKRKASRRAKKTGESSTK